MIKSIRLDKDHEIVVDSAAGWLFKYKNQFGRDILPDLMPIMNSMVKMASEFIESASEENSIAGAIEKASMNGALDNALMELSGLETTTVFECVWAMAANHADQIKEEIDPPEQWVNNFPRFPLDTVLPQILSTFVDTFASSKNAKRLKTALSSLKASQSQRTA